MRRANVRRRCRVPRGAVLSTRSTLSESRCQWQLKTAHFSRGRRRRHRRPPGMSARGPAASPNRGRVRGRPPFHENALTPDPPRPGLHPDVDVGLPTPCPQRLFGEGTGTMDKAWTTPPTPCRGNRTGVGFRVARGSVPRFLVSLDRVVRVATPARRFGQPWRRALGVQRHCTDRDRNRNRTATRTAAYRSRRCWNIAQFNGSRPSTEPRNRTSPFSMRAKLMRLPMSRRCRR